MWLKKNTGLNTIPWPKKLDHYSFVLFESEAKELSDYKNDYKYGFGVSLDIQKHQGVFIQLSEV